MSNGVKEKNNIADITIEKYAIATMRSLSAIYFGPNKSFHLAIV
jgi:hypothetical protein